MSRAQDMTPSEILARAERRLVQSVIVRMDSFVAFAAQKMSVDKGAIADGGGNDRLFLPAANEVSDAAKRLALLDLTDEILAAAEEMELLAWAVETLSFRRETPVDIGITAKWPARRAGDRSTTREHVAWWIERVLRDMEEIALLPEKRDRESMWQMRWSVHVRESYGARWSPPIAEAGRQRDVAAPIKVLSDAEWQRAVKLLRREIFSTSTGFISSTGTLANTAKGLVGTELSRAVSAGKGAATDANGHVVTTRAWVSVLDEKNEAEPDDEKESDCRSRDGLTIEEITARFGRYTPPPLHINCRCDTIPVYAEYAALVDKYGSAGAAPPQKTITDWLDEL